MEKGRPLKILMLEDNPDDAGLIERLLKKEQVNFISERVDTRNEFDNSIKRFVPDVILSDHGMPEFNSIEALKICSRERVMAPFILVTGTVSEEFAATCLKLGADDYILKSNLSRLPSAIHRALKERKLEYLKREARRALRNQNKQLLKANEQLVKINHELDKFVYSVSHNLRGPLTSVMGLVNVAKLGISGPELASVYDMINKSIIRLDDTLQEILDYSRNARNEIEVEEIDLESLIKSTIESLEIRYPEKSINWIIRVEQQRPLKTDKTRLSVMLTNLLSNAIVYSDHEKESFVKISGTVTTDHLNVSIKDNGIGIRGEVMPRVFEMFYRGTEVSQGAGLGLYIAKEIINRVSGTIEITSEAGNGTTVVFTMPNA
ncbi:MAG TPA: ATP-binding protein [Chryseosolibacter sp.]